MAYTCRKDDSLKRPTPSQLRAFNEVASLGSFSRAARALEVSQPAVTAQVRALEDSFDVRLFDRTGAGAELTPIGRRLFHRTSELRDTEREAAEILLSARNLEVGEMSIFAGSPMPSMRLIARFRDLYPGIRIRIQFGNWQQVMNAIRDRNADLGIVTEAPQGGEFERQPFVEQTIIALIPIGHPLARRDSISLTELRDEPLLFRTTQSLTQRKLNDALQAEDLHIEPLLVLETREAVYEACAQGLGIGFMYDAASTRLDRVVRVRIKELSGVHYPEDVFCLKSQRNLRAISALFSLAKTTYES